MNEVQKGIAIGKLYNDNKDLPMEEFRLFLKSKVEANEISLGYAEAMFRLHTNSHYGVGRGSAK